MCNANTDAIPRIRYTANPPSHLRSNEIANNDVNDAGPMARTIDASSWPIPFVVPNERRLGAEVVINMNIHPKIHVQ